MYNRYIPQDTSYDRIPEQGSPEPQQRRKASRPPPVSAPGGSGPLDGILGRLGGLLKGFHLEGLDSGDILLILILLFLFLESDDELELVIVLGLLLFFGLTDKKEKPEDQSDPTV